MKEKPEIDRDFWDSLASSFDLEPDHGLSDPVVYNAWSELLAAWLPDNPCKVLEVGCGTGSLSLLAAQLGNQVTGIDYSPEMVKAARKKATSNRQEINFFEMDASWPDFSPHTIDVVLCRHVLWSLPDPGVALQNWYRLLKTGGRVIIIEGIWEGGAGIMPGTIKASLPEGLKVSEFQNLSSMPALWGRAVDDTRFALLAVATQSRDQ